MTISAELVPGGKQHARTTGSINVGPAKGQVPAIGTNQLLLLPLPFSTKDYANDRTAFEAQFYILAKSLDGNVSDIRLDATPFEYADGVPPNLRLRVDILASPAAVQIELEAHHSVGR